MLLNLAIYPAEVLFEKASPITEFNQPLRDLAANMIETMYHYEGVGLAGNQVFHAQQILVLDVSDNGDSPQVIINPKIVHHSGEKRSAEGCLSIPGYRESIQRYETVSVEYNDLEGQQQVIQNASGLLAVCLQHEIDHLEGVLFVDRLSLLKKQLFRRWVRKNLPANDLRA